MTYDRVDANQPEIVDNLRDVGASVISLASVKFGCPDLLVGFRGENFLMEVKTKRGKLTAAQEKWHKEWRGQVCIVRTVDEALRVIGAVE